MAEYEIPDKPGVYTLVIRLARGERAEIGRFGSHWFSEGLYTYTGSALGTGGLSLRGRVLRHLSSEKKMKWHIDYLLASRGVSVIAVVYAETCSRMECSIAKSIACLEDAVSPVKGFGASDCRNGCESHLYHFPESDEEQLLRRLCEVYEELGLSPKTLLPRD